MAVAGVLGGLNYRVTQAIGADQQASDVLALLYRQPYRIVHVSAHGVFDLLHRDGLPPQRRRAVRRPADHRRRDRRDGGGARTRRT